MRPPLLSAKEEVPLEVFALAAFGLLRQRTRWPNSYPMIGLPLLFPFS